MDGLIEQPGRRVELTVLTNSEVQTFRNCGYLWGLSYEEGLRPKVAPRPLAFGSGIHAGLEAVARLLGDPRFVGLDADDCFEALSPIAVAGMKSKFGEWYKKRLEQGMSDDALMAMAEEAEETQAMARWMVGHYVRKFHADWTNLIALGVEHPFNVRLRDARGYHSPHFAWAGVIDLVAYDRRVGDIVVDDHKTTSGDVGSIDRRVELDPQMAGYLSTVRELLAAGSIRPLSDAAAPILEAAKAGKIATGRVRYNVLRKKLPSEPKFNKDGTVSTAAIDTFAENYEQALAIQAAHGKPVSEKQAELLQALRDRGDTFLSRREFWRSDEEIERWRRETFVDARRIREAKRDPYARTRNPGHCTMPWSMRCSHRSICLDPTSPEHREHFEVVPRHVEVDAAKAAAGDEDDV